MSEGAAAPDPLLESALVYERDRALIDELVGIKAEHMVDRCAWLTARYLAGMVFEACPRNDLIVDRLRGFALRVWAIAEAADKERG